MDWAKAWNTWALFNTTVMSHYTLRGFPDFAGQYVVAGVTPTTAKGVDDSLQVPFRLIRVLVKAMEVSVIEGNFRSTCENVMQVLRTNKDSVMAMMEVCCTKIF